MAVELPHSKLITSAARDVLRPLGLRRRGRSRVWLDDRGWWLGVVEFQPPVAGMPADALPLAVHVHAGKFLAASLGAGVSEDGFLFDFNSTLLVEWGFTPEVLEAAMPAVLEAATKVLGEKLLRGSFAF